MEWESTSCSAISHMNVKYVIRNNNELQKLFILDNSTIKCRNHSLNMTNNSLYVVKQNNIYRYSGLNRDKQKREVFEDDLCSNILFEGLNIKVCCTSNLYMYMLIHIT